MDQGAGVAWQKRYSGVLGFFPLFHHSITKQAGMPPQSPHPGSHRAPRDLAGMTNGSIFVNPTTIKRIFEMTYN